ncbi:hypothetical protein TrVGV298_008058 [Trichoderma virens]|nr:hypothetical protein TrVGV298_008058 [Trichoderma virens]
MHMGQPGRGASSNPGGTAATTNQSSTLERFKHACSECQRRKQKCNRIYPCIHCQSRGAERLCKYIEKPCNDSSNNNIASGNVDSLGQNSAAVGSESSDRLLPGLSGDDDLTLPSLDAEVSPLLELPDLLMKKNGILTRKFSNCHCPFIDALALSFFQNVNPHYGMIHRTDFGREYNRWWKKRTPISRYQFPGLACY